MSKKYLKYIVIIFLCLWSVIYGLSDRDVAGGGTRAEVSGRRLIRVGHVFDGDTVGAIIGGRSEKVRLTGIDAPEMGQRPWGKRSKQRLDGILSASSRNVGLELDVAGRDKHGRLLGYLWTPEGRLINEMLVREGYAVLFTIPPNVKYADLFVVAEKEARQRGLGIWGSGGLRQTPGEYRKAHPRGY